LVRSSDSKGLLVIGHYELPTPDPELLFNEESPWKQTTTVSTVTKEISAVSL
jgi:hypothetical protein